MQTFSLIGQLIVLLKVAWIDLAHSPAVSLVPTWPSFAEAFPPIGPARQSAINRFCSQPTRSTYSTFVPMLLQCWKQCGAAWGWL